MELILTNKLRSFNIVRIMDDLLKGIYKNYPDTYNKPENLRSIDAFVDYTIEFLKYYFKELEVDIDEASIVYMANRLYESKGKLEVFETMNTLLHEKMDHDTGEYVLPIGVEYTYDLPELKLTFENITTSNMDLFLKRLIDMLNVLLFFDEDTLKISIENLRFIIRNRFTRVIQYCVNSYNLINYDGEDN